MIGLLLLACTAADDARDSAGAGVVPGTLTVTPGALEFGYAEATGTAPGASRTRVVVSSGDTTWLVTDWADGPDADATPLVGLPPSAELVATLEDDAGVARATASFTTGAAPTSLAALTPAGTATWHGYAFTSLLGPEDPAALVLAPTGDVVWAVDVPGNPLIRVLPRPDGAGIWALAWTGDPQKPNGKLLSFAWNGEPLAELTPRGHADEGLTHDFLPEPDGTLLFLGQDTREVDHVLYAGDTLFRLDPATGTETALWSTWDRFTPTPDAPDPREWTHANTLRRDETAGTVWVGLWSLNTLVELDPATWTVVHQLGGEGADLTLTAGTPLASSHGFVLRGDTLLVHDNRDVTAGSRIVRYALDRAAGTATQTWEYVPDPAIYDYILGDVAWDDEDTLLAAWSTSGRLDEIGLDGAVPWSVGLDLGNAFGYLERRDSLLGGAAGAGNE